MPADVDDAGSRQNMPDEPADSSVASGHTLPVTPGKSASSFPDVPVMLRIFKMKPSLAVKKASTCVEWDFSMYFFISSGEHLPCMPVPLFVHEGLLLNWS